MKIPIQLKAHHDQMRDRAEKTLTQHHADVDHSVKSGWMMKGMGEILKQKAEGMHADYMAVLEQVEKANETE